MLCVSSASSVYQHTSFELGRCLFVKKRHQPLTLLLYLRYPPILLVVLLLLCLVLLCLPPPYPVLLHTNVRLEICLEWSGVPSTKPSCGSTDFASLLKVFLQCVCSFLHTSCKCPGRRLCYIVTEAEDHAEGCEANEQQYIT